jgi:O-antigen ligase
MTALPVHAERLTRWIVVALGFSIPISVALDSVLVALLLLAWIASGGWQRKFDLIRHNPVAVIAGIFFLAYLAGTAYSIGSPKDVLHALDKASVLLLIPLLVSISLGENARKHALRAFEIALAVTLVLSFLVWLDVVPQGRFIKGTPEDAVVFKLRITHSILMAFGAYLFATEARRASGRWVKAAFAILAAAAAFNVLFMVEGRTGQLVFLALLFCFLLQTLGRKGLLVAAAASGLIVAAAWLVPQSTLHQRTALALKEIAGWRPGEPSATSVGQRLEFYRNSLRIVREHPILGVGTGGFPQAYARAVRGTGLAATQNPHNEYAMVAVQLGLIGLGLLLGLWIVQWRLAAALPGAADCQIARALVLTLATASLVSSTLIDHTEGLFYAWLSGVLFSGLPRPSREKIR